MNQNKVDSFIKHPRKALFILAMPIVIGMMVQSLYNIVDTAFVGRLGSDAIAALTFAFPMFFILIAVNSGIGVGMSSRISRYLGAKNKTAAENTAMHGILISFITGLLLFVLGMIFLKPLFSLFGAYNSVLELSISYMSIVLMGIFFMFPAFVMSGIFSAQGDTKTPMIVQTIALVINIILDPIFIFVLDMGVGGAALATVTSFTTTFFIFIFLLKKRSYLNLNFKSFRFSWHLSKEIFKVGAPASIMMLLMSISFIFLNRFMAHFSMETVAMFGIVFRLNSLAFMPIAGFAMGAMTLVGMFYGAKRYDLLKDIIWFAIKIGVAFTAFMGALFFIFPQMFLRIFTPDQNIISMGVPFVRIFVIELPLAATSMFISRSLQGLGLGLPGLVINSVRMILVAIPIAYFFVFIMEYGYLSIAVSTIIGAALSTIVAVIWLTLKLRTCNKG